MKSFIYVTLLLITLSFCDDCSKKEKNDCTGSCKWTEGTAATCAKKTDCGTPSGTVGSKTCTDATNCKPNDDESACVSVADTCALKDDNSACDDPAAGCVFTAATQDSCTELSSDPDSDSDSDSDSDTTKSSAFGLKTSFLLIFLYFFL